MRNVSDESLLAGLGSGDPDATAVFVRWFQRRVFGLTFSILRDHGAAEEAAQELRARMEARFGLRPVTRNRGSVAADHQHAAGAALRPDRPGGPSRLEAKRPREDGPRRSCGRGAAANAAGSTCRGPAASPGLAVLYGFTAREISELDGVPLGTVKTRIRAAMMKLRSELMVSDDQ
jgi:RNA polymerase sigma-70 factor (ECF subfamily)